MFKVGDKVVYPMHGAGVIESIEEKEVLGERRNYYIMRIPVGEMRVMVPLDNVQGIGLRQIINDQEMTEVVHILKNKSNTMNVSWNKRFRANMDKIKSGDIYEVAEVVKNLSIRDKDKGLSTGERKMLENAKRILVSEWVLVSNIEESQVEDILQSVLD